MNALSPNTAMIAAISAVEHQMEFGPPIPKSRAHGPGPEVMLPAELIEVGKKAGVPVLVDFASDIPPNENLTKFTKMGADLVVLSGGKAMRGPQSVGILAGRKDLIEAAALNAFPNANIGRGMKVGKEEVIGLIVALDWYLKLDITMMEARWKAKARYIADQLQRHSRRDGGGGDEHGRVQRRRPELGSSSVIPLTEQQVKERLKAGEPPLIYDGTTVRTRCLWDGEEVLVARRLRDVLNATETLRQGESCGSVTLRLCGLEETASTPHCSCASFSNRGLPRRGSKLGSTRSQPERDRGMGALSSRSSASIAVSGVPESSVDEGEGSKAPTRRPTHLVSIGASAIG